MEKSTWMVYSIISNVYTFLYKGHEIDFFKKAHIAQFKKAHKFFVVNAKRIYNDIENGYYTYHDLIVHLLFQHMMGERMNLYRIKPKTIRETMKLFTHKQFKEDLKLLQQIHTELKFKKGIKDYFDIKEDGTNIAYILTKKRRISPIFFIRNFEKNLTNRKENVIIGVSKEYEQFQRIAKKIKETLKGGLLDE